MVSRKTNLGKNTILVSKFCYFQFDLYILVAINLVFIFIVISLTKNAYAAHELLCWIV